MYVNKLIYAILQQEVYNKKNFAQCLECGPLQGQM